MSFSREHLDDGSVSEAAIELKAHAEVRTPRFFVLASSWFILLSRRLRCLYLAVHRLLQSSSAVAAAERLTCPPVHTLASPIPVLLGSATSLSSGPPVLSTPEQGCSPCPVLFCRCRPAGSLPCPLLFYSVLSFLPSWGLFIISFFTKQTCEFLPSRF